MSKDCEISIYGANAAQVGNEIVVFSTAINSRTKFWVFGLNGRFLRQTLDEVEGDKKNQHAAAFIVWEGSLCALNK